MVKHKKTVVLALLMIISTIFTSFSASATNNRMGEFMMQIEHQASEMTPDFTRIAQNDTLALYLNETSLAIRIITLATGYMFSSDVDDFREEHVNDTWRAFINSGITIEYVRVENGLMERRTIDESFLTSSNSTASITRLDNGFLATVSFGNSGIELTYSVVLNNETMRITLESDSIIESDEFKLVSVQFFPFLGATRYGEQDGYFVIPDGVGAMVSFDNSFDNVSTPYSNRYFGEDLAVTTEEIWDNYSRTLSLPIYGVVHGENRHAFYTEVISGAPYAQLRMYPAGVRTSFYSISNRFMYRQLFTHLISADNQTIMFTSERANFDIIEDIHFLSNEQANYVGIASHYRNNLINRGYLNESSRETKTVPVSLEIIGAATSEGIFFNRDEIMTTFEQTRTIVNDLNNYGVYPIYVSFDGGFRNETSGRERGRYSIRNGLGNERSRQNLMELFNNSANSFAFMRNYTYIYSNFSGINTREDVVRRINNQFVIREVRFGAVNYRHHLLNMSGFRKAFESDVNHLLRLGIDNLSIQLPTPNSSINSEVISRTDAFTLRTHIMRDVADDFNTSVVFDGTITHDIFPYLNQLRYAPMETSLYPFVTDQIPLFPLVLRGSIDLFSPNLNYVANPAEMVLRMIEWGIYPQFQITYESSSRMMYTLRPEVVTSRYDDWRGRIVDIYEQVNRALSPVRGEMLINHAKIAPGVMVSTFSNDVRIYVNYTSNDVVVNNITVAARGFEVVR